MALNPKIKKQFQANLKKLHKRNCFLSLDATGLAYVVVDDKTGYMITGPWSHKEMAAHQAVIAQRRSRNTKLKDQGE